MAWSLFGPPIAQLHRDIDKLLADARELGVHIEDGWEIGIAEKKKTLTKSKDLEKWWKSDPVVKILRVCPNKNLSIS